MDEKTAARSAKDLLALSEKAIELYRRRSAFQDARESLIKARPYRLWKQLLLYLRRVRMISFLLRTFSVLFSILQTGALVLITTAVFFILLPVLLLFFLLIAIAALLDRKRSLRLLEQELLGKRVYVFFGIQGEFGKGYLRALAACEGNAVILLSPYWISGKGFGRPLPFLNLRRDAPSLFFVRRYFYFSLRRRLDPNRLILIF